MTSPSKVAEIAEGLSALDRQAWLEVIAYVDVGEAGALDPAVCRFFQTRELMSLNREITPLGLLVAQHLKDNSNG